MAPTAALAARSTAIQEHMRGIAEASSALPRRRQRDDVGAAIAGYHAAISNAHDEIRRHAGRHPRGRTHHLHPDTARVTARPSSAGSSCSSSSSSSSSSSPRCSSVHRLLRSARGSATPRPDPRRSPGPCAGGAARVCGLFPELAAGGGGGRVLKEERLLRLGRHLCRVEVSHTREPQDGTVTSTLRPLYMHA